MGGKLVRVIVAMAVALFILAGTSQAQQIKKPTVEQRVNMKRTQLVKESGEGSTEVLQLDLLGWKHKMFLERLKVMEMQAIARLYASDEYVAVRHQVQDLEGRMQIIMKAPSKIKTEEKKNTEDLPTAHDLTVDPIREIVKEEIKKVLEVKKDEKEMDH